MLAGGMVVYGGLIGLCLCLVLVGYVFELLLTVLLCCIS